MLVALAPGAPRLHAAAPGNVCVEEAFGDRHRGMGIGYSHETVPLGTAYAVWTGIGAAGTAVLPLVSSASSNRYTLGVAQNGTAYTGSDFYNEWRGRNADGTPSTAKSNMIAPAPGVDLATIPMLARYVFEVFKAGSSTPADTFAVRAVAIGNEHVSAWLGL